MVTEQRLLSAGHVCMLQCRVQHDVTACVKRCCDSPGVLQLTVTWNSWRGSSRCLAASKLGMNRILPQMGQYVCYNRNTHCLPNM